MGEVPWGLAHGDLAITVTDTDQPKKKQRARRGEPPPEGGVLVVRGDLLDPDELESDARDNFDVYGFYGISVYAEVGGADIDRIARHKLRRAEWLVLFEARNVLDAGLELWDTGLTPHYDVVHADADELVTRLVGCWHRLVRNVHYQEGGS
jgi:hypothetical protein